MIFVNLSKYEHLNSIQSLEELLLEFHITLLKINKRFNMEINKFISIDNLIQPYQKELLIYYKYILSNLEIKTIIIK